MAHLFSNSPGNSPADSLTDNDKAALQCILERKTKGVPKGLRAETTLPLDLIIRGIDPQTNLSLSLFPFPPTTPQQNLPQAATFSGHLHYRGTIMNNVRNHLPLSQWGDEVLLAYFTSNVDPNRNFAKFFEETRARLYEMLVERAGLGEQVNAVQEAYLKACMEYKGHTAVLDPQRPVRHQMQFITLLRERKGQFNGVAVRTHAHNQRLLKLAAKHVNILRAKHWDRVDPTSRMYLDFFAPQRTLPEIKKKKKKRGPRGKGKGKATEDHDDEDDDNDGEPAHSTTALDPGYLNEPRTNLFYDPQRIRPCTMNNPLMEGLIAHMPGMVFGDIVTICDDTVFDSAGLADALPGAEDDDGNMEMDYDDEDFVDKFERVVQLDDPDNILIL